MLGMVMATAKQIERDPLLAGFYSLKDADRLIGSGSTQKLRSWINGWPNSSSGPIVQRDFSDKSTVSFLDLIELRFVQFFRRQGVSMQTLRKAAQRAREEWKVSHPFALSEVQYLTDRKDVFAQVSEELDDKVTWDLTSGQYMIWKTIESSIARGVMFDPSSHLAVLWRPSPEEHPNIVVNPARAFGKPSLSEAGIPTSALFSQWKAEEGNIARVAKWFGVSDEDVQSAVHFEVGLAA